MDAQTIRDEARKLADRFNLKHGVTLLQVIEPANELVTVDELRTLATAHPGPYMAASAYQQIKGRKPRHGELVKLGHLLGHLMVARRKDGPYTLWLLDKAFAQRSH